MTVKEAMRWLNIMPDDAEIYVAGRDGKILQGEKHYVDALGLYPNPEGERAFVAFIGTYQMTEIAEIVGGGGDGNR